MYRSLSHKNKRQNDRKGRYCLAHFWENFKISSIFFLRIFFFFLAQTTNNLIFEGVCEHVDEHIVGGGWVHAQKQNIYDVSLNKS